MQLLLADFNDPQVVELLASHLDTARAATAEHSAHALDLAQLQTPQISLWAAWRHGSLLGVGGLKRLSAAHGEIKSMHTARSARRQGVGAAILAHLIGIAQREGLLRLSLETGSWDYFRPAWALYRSHGFVECAPFGDYRADPNSVFMRRDLAPLGAQPACAG